MSPTRSESSDSDSDSVLGLSSRTPQRDFCDSCLPVKLHVSGYATPVLTCDQLEKSAKDAHCRTCVGLFRFIEAQQPRPSKFKVYRYHDSLELSCIDSEGSEISFHEIYSPADGLAHGETSKYCVGPSEPARYIPLRHEPSGDTSSTAAFNTLRQWIYRCQEEHPLCEQVSDKGLPHRILKINSVRPLRVQVVEDCPDRRGYACLSHRWGPHTKINSLKKANLHIYKAGIPVENIDPLMRDAMEATFRLGYCFIWIDCYCIIQDDRKDWENEAANMGSIYEQAVFTISAVSSTSNSGRGMFSSLSHELKPIEVAKVNGQQVYVRKQIEHPCGLEGFLQAKEYSENELLTRGWVFQERMLSKRFIHFTSEEIFWECCEATWCECEFRSAAWELQRSRVKRTVGDSSWEDIANAYDKKALTLKKDKLPALGGVARRYGELKGDWTYLAGLWKEQLPYCLVWSKMAWHSPRPLDQDVPTWSWACQPWHGDLRSMSSRMIGRRKGGYTARFVGYRNRPSDTDVYTSGGSIEIRIRGLVLELTVYKHSCGFLAGRVEDVDFPIRPDFKTDPVNPACYRAVSDGERALLLVLSLDGENDACGIVLQKKKKRDATSKIARFERIGFLTTDDKWYFDRSGQDYGRYCRGPRTPFNFPYALIPNGNLHQWLRERADERVVTLV